MDILLINSDGDRNFYPVNILTFLPCSSTLYVAKKGTASIIDEEKKSDCFDIYKVDFIANCSIATKSANTTLGFYLQNSELRPFVISYGDLALNYYWNDEYIVFDYDNYCKICALTKEDILPFPNFIQAIFREQCLNSLFEHHGFLYNITEADELYKQNLTNGLKSKNKK